MAILTKFLDFAMFGTRDLGYNGKKFKKNIYTISINHYICPIFHVENNLSKLQFNFDHIILVVRIFVKRATGLLSGAIREPYTRTSTGPNKDLKTLPLAIINNHSSHPTEISKSATTTTPPALQKYLNPPQPLLPRALQNI
jgi:hypothetical protein